MLFNKLYYKLINNPFFVDKVDGISDSNEKFNPNENIDINWNQADNNPWPNHIPILMIYLQPLGANIDLHPIMSSLYPRTLYILISDRVEDIHLDLNYFDA